MPLFVLGGATADQVNLFGTVIRINSQNSVGLVVSVMYIYFLWRYGQYFGKEDRAKVFRSILERKLYDAEFQFFSNLVFPKIECFEYKNYYICFKTKENKLFGVEDKLPKASMDARIGLFRKSRMMEVYGLPDRYKNYYLKSEGMRSPMTQDEKDAINKSWKIVDVESSDPRSGSIFETPVEYNVFRRFWIRSIVKMKFIFSHPYFSDYELPFIVAGLSFLITVLNL